VLQCVVPLDLIFEKCCSVLQCNTLQHFSKIRSRGTTSVSKRNGAHLCGGYCVVIVRQKSVVVSVQQSKVNLFLNMKSSYQIYACQLSDIHYVASRLVTHI